ncbi:hypothetical protein FB451DRAFT_1569700 [Mycena latifolia]|nr:hypothetical protein FB451DRAFT_1569700 [Mycena latifolia]
MCEVFVSTHDLSVHHGAPQNLPLLPQLGSPQREAPTRAPSPQFFGSQSPYDHCVRRPDDRRTTLDLLQLATPDLSGLGSDFGSPLFGNSDVDLDAFLTSPMATPPDDTPFSTFLVTPPLPFDDFGESGYAYVGGQSLFGGITAPPYELTRSPHRYGSPETLVSRKTTASTMVDDEWIPRKLSDPSEAPSVEHAEEGTRR